MFPTGVKVARSAAPPLQRRLATKGTQASSRYATLSTLVTFRCKDERSTMRHFHTIPHHDGMHAVSSRSFSSSRNSKSFTRQKTTMVPRKAALALTPKSRDIFQKIIAATGSEGIMLKYEMSTQHALRMAFKFDLIKDAKKELDDQDEGVSLEVLEDGVTPKPPSESMDDNLPKLYVHHAAFMKVLGGTIDVDFDSKTGDLTPKLFDREGNVMDPNA
mmetsp:Transcript_5200/g.9188  ORF Transcript_5200/g.9188 Transcript_5200/m.9188 type:complete len:217 (-) Transcript_5200:73-723(-)